MADTEVSAVDLLLLGYVAGKREVLERVRKDLKVHSGYSGEVDWAYERVRLYVKEELEKIND